MACWTVVIFSASSSGISVSNSSSRAITNSTVSSESAPRSSTNEASLVTSSSLTPNCSATIFLTCCSTVLIVMVSFGKALFRETCQHAPHCHLGARGQPLVGRARILCERDRDCYLASGPRRDGLKAPLTNAGSWGNKKRPRYPRAASGHVHAAVHVE